MKSTAPFILLLAFATLGYASEPGSARSPEPATPPPTREAFYCQPPVWGTANASIGYNSEIADDIPDSLSGRMIEKIVLYAGEWMGYWQDPYGIAINIYQSECPPDLDWNMSYVFTWGELNPDSVYFYPSTQMKIYEVTAILPEPITIEPAMSIGCYVIHDWGTNAPFCGFCITEYVNPPIYGCNELYWDNVASGSPRWTPFSDVTGYYADLAYCLFDVATSVPEIRGVSTWGGVKRLFR